MPRSVLIQYAQRKALRQLIEQLVQERTGDEPVFDSLLLLAVQMRHHRRWIEFPCRRTAWHRLFDQGQISCAQLDLQSTKGFLQSVTTARTDQWHDILAPR